MSGPFAMRANCKACGCPHGTVTERNGQDVVRCAECDTYAYCAPRVETGREVRTVRTRPDIKPSTKARILERDGHACVSCHTTSAPLHVGHLLSVDDGRKLGATDEELFHDDNLASVCSECNLGLGARSVSLRLVYRILQARIRWSKEATDAA